MSKQKKKFGQTTVGKLINTWAFSDGTVHETEIARRVFWKVAMGSMRPKTCSEDHSEL